METKACSPRKTAEAVLDRVPLLMRSVRARMRRHRGAELSVPQFRVLAFVRRNPGASLSDVGQHVGTSLPSMSKLVAGLVARELLSRTPSPTDRRRVVLALTPTGTALLRAARRAVQAQLARQLEGLSPADRRGIVNALSTLTGLLAPEEGIEK